MGESSEQPSGLAARMARGLRRGVNRLATVAETGFNLVTRGDSSGVAASGLTEALAELRRAHLPEAALMLADLLPRSLQASQQVTGLLPELLAYDDGALISLYHAAVVAALQQDREAGLRLIKQLPETLKGLPPFERRRYLGQVLKGVQRDHSIGEALAEQLPTLLARLDEDALDAFLLRGFELWKESPQKARSFFRLESRLGQAEIEALRRALPLTQVRRTLQLYAQAHGGPHVRVASVEELPAQLRPGGRSRAFTDGRSIYLPAEVARYASEDDNFRLYKAMTAIEAGKVEFGTFTYAQPTASAAGEEARPTAELLAAGAQALTRRLTSEPDPRVATDLFNLLETYRIERRILYEYPGLRGDLQRLTEDGLPLRPPLEGLEETAAVLELLALRLWTGERRLHRGLEAHAAVLEPLVAPLAQPEARVEDTLEVVSQCVRTLLTLLAEPERVSPADPPPQPDAESTEPSDAEEGESSTAGNSRGQGTSPRSSMDELRPGEKRRNHTSFEPLPYQGRILPELAAQLQEQALQAQLAEPAEASGALDGSPEEARGPFGEVTGPLEELGESNLPPGEHVGPEGAADAGGEVLGVRLYPEWDYQIEDYKDDWCRVIEERLPEGSSVFADETLARHGTLVNGLKRQFQRIRREELEKLRRQAEGDELDLEALTEALIERRSGHPPSERLYIKRQKQLRDVAVAFLVDLSSSTHQSVQGGARTILDIEKESLLLMAEALESLGDPYAIYGFSGYGRQKVSFYVAREFGEPYTRQVRDRVGGMTGRLENRDGAAIRHAVRKLMAQPARVRLLFLLSDGRPLDCGCRQYVERYAQEDTRMALREARMQGVHPFCITVDRFAQRYLSRMYGQVHYTIIDQVTALPGRLPVIYRRLTT